MLGHDWTIISPKGYVPRSLLREEEARVAFIIAYCYSFYMTLYTAVPVYASYCLEKTHTFIASAMVAR